MRLTELSPQFCAAGGPGIYNADGTPATPRRGIGLMFNCPCGCSLLCYVPFRDPIDGGPARVSDGEPSWERTGETFDALTLRPSILRDQAKGGCGWHGFITAGEVTGC